MTCVIGDIHGCLRSLNHLLDRLKPTQNDTVITLGDYVDRGPASKGVIDRLIRLQDETNLIALRGNHETMMEDAREGPPSSSFWLLNGGIETLESYQTRSLEAVPEEHWKFLETLKSHHVFENFLMVHATPPFDKKIEDCDQDDLYWARFREPKDRTDNLFLICGHTPQDKHLPTLYKGNLCLDTGCVHRGFLTALTLESGAYLQADEQGKIRKGEVKLPISEIAA